MIIHSVQNLLRRRQRTAPVNANKAAPAPDGPVQKTPNPTVNPYASALLVLKRRLTEIEKRGISKDSLLTASRLCERYLVSMEEALRSSKDALSSLRVDLEYVREAQRNYMMRWAYAESKHLMKEAQESELAKDKLATARRALLVLDDAGSICPDEAMLVESVYAVREFICSTQIAELIADAQKATFKGFYEKAIEHYQEALFYLSRAEVNYESLKGIADRLCREIELLRAHLKIRDLWMD